MRSLGFHHLAIQATDVERVAAFYRDVLGLSELERYHREDGTLRSVWLAVDGHGGLGGFLAVEHLPHGQPRPAASLGPSMVALRIAPAERPLVLAHLAAHQVPVERSTAWTLYVRDPEGTLVGLSHHPFDAPP